MASILFYYTGTGNSLWVARMLAKQLGDTEIIPIAGFNGDPEIADGKTVGLVFPVHMWGVPHAVLKLLGTLKGTNPSYFFAIAVNANQVANTLVQLKKAAQKHRLPLGSGIEVTMPSNYIPWGGPGPRDKWNELFAKAEEKLGWYANVVAEKQIRSVQRGPLWQRIIFSWIYGMSTPHIAKMDRAFRADEKCTGCGMCYKVCPTANISIDKGKPVWKGNCEQCFACLQWCPAKAIQYGKKTPLYERYHQPEITAQDMVRRPYAP